jgi:hypothetical protein
MACEITGLIGIADTEPSCFTGTRPSDWNVSESGYYLLDPEYGMRVYDDCKFNGWEVCTRAISMGAAALKSDLRQAVYQNNNRNWVPFSGYIGEAITKGTNNNARAYIGTFIKIPNVKKGMKLILSELLLGLDATGTFDVTIRSNIPNFEDITFEVESIADRWKVNDLSGSSIELDMHTDHPLEYIEYWATIERGSARPLESNFGCCGSRPAWRQYFDFSGYGDTDGLGSSSQVTGQTNGFVWKVNLGCDDFQWVCELEALGDYETKSVIARALQFRAALFAYSLILNSGTTVNLCTLYKSEEIAGHRNFLNNKYAEYIQYASENIPNGASSCFSCSKSAFTLTDIHL